MENLSKLTSEDLKKLQKGILEELSRRDNEAWNIAADNFKKAYEELMRIGISAPQVLVSVFYEEDGYGKTEPAEIINLSVDKENKAITFEAEEICI